MYSFHTFRHVSLCHMCVNDLWLTRHRCLHLMTILYKSHCTSVVGFRGVFGFREVFGLGISTDTGTCSYCTGKGDRGSGDR